MHRLTYAALVTFALLIGPTQALSQRVASISGVVVNAVTSDPLPNAKVSVFGAPMPVMTDNNGRFQLDGINAGSHTVQVEKEGYALGGAFDGLHVAASEGEQVKNLIIRLTPEAVITGRVLDQGGMPVSARLSLNLASNAGSVRSAFSSKNGDFRINKVPPGEYKLEASPFPTASALQTTYYPTAATLDSAGVIRITAGEQISAITIVMQAIRLSPVTGKFTGEIPPGRMAHIAAEQRPRLRGNATRSILLRPDGSFSLPLPDGNYTLKVNAIGGNERPMVIGMQNISVAGSPVADIIVPPVQLRKVRTRIQWKAPGRTVPPDVSVMFNPLEGNGIMQFGKRTDSGDWEATLSPDRYSVLIGKLPSGAYVKSLTAANSNIIQTGLDLLAGTVTDVEATLADDGGTITVQVTSASRESLQGALLWLARETSTQAEAQFYSRSTACSSEGICTLTGVAPGEYKAGVNVNQQKAPVQTIQVAPNSQQQIQFTIR